VVRILPGLLASGSVLILVALLTGGRFAEALFGVTAVLFPVALIGLGAGRRRPGLRLPLAALAAILVLSALGVLLLPVDAPIEDHRFGLPAAAWVALLGLGLVPFVLVAWTHAATFDGSTRRPASGADHKHG